VSVLHIPEKKTIYAGRTQNWFTYRVRITYEGDEDSDFKARLTTRCWEVYDGNKPEPQTVDHQPGVIGLYPEVYYGMNPFHYCSWSATSAKTGHMQGSFQFRVEDSDEEFDAIVGKFRFDVNKSNT